MKRLILSAMAAILLSTSVIGCTAYVAGPPPPARYEAVGVAPYPGAVWIDGYWTWNGRWVWHRGYWGRRPYAGAVWHRGVWVHAGHGWKWRRGYWR